jgi:hypothetical protein
MPEDVQKAVPNHTNRESDRTYIAEPELLGVNEPTVEHVTMWNVRAFGAFIATGKHNSRRPKSSRLSRVQKYAAVFFLLTTAGCSFYSIGPAAATRRAANDIKIETLSSQPERVSGGDALMRIALPHPTSFLATLNGEDVTGVFRSSGRVTSYLGLIRGLKKGKNVLEVRSSNRLHASVTLVNHPIQDPIVSGPRIRGFSGRALSAPDECQGSPPDDLGRREEHGWVS